MTPDELARLRALADAATVGPREAFGTHITAWAGDAGCEGCSGILSPQHAPECGEREVAGADAPDAAFIAAARTAVPALLDEVERLRAEVDRQTRWTERQQARADRWASAHQGLATDYASARAERARRAAQIKAVWELHEPDSDLPDRTPRCMECAVEEWPCRTLLALGVER